MHAKAVTIAALTGTIALMTWQTISNVAIPWHEATMQQTADTTAGAIQTLRQIAPANGVYYNNYGLLMAVSPTADVADKATSMMGPMLGRQLAINFVVVLGLCLLVGRLAPTTPVRIGTTAALLALLIVGLKEVSDWNWYGFTLPYALVNTIDQAIGWFVAGWTVSTMLRRFGGGVPAGATTVPAGEGYRSPASFTSSAPR